MNSSNNLQAMDKEYMENPPPGAMSPVAKQLCSTILSLFLQNQSPLDVPNSALRTPLHDAAAKFNTGVAVQLIRNGASLCLPDAKDCSPLDVWDPPASPEDQKNISEAQQVMLLSVSALGTWLPDKASTVCQICKASFSFGNRKHHCRYCGRLVCKKCLPMEKDIPKFNLKNVKVCATCSPVVDILPAGQRYMQQLKGATGASGSIHNR